MYLARRRIRQKTYYSIRHSYATDDGYKSRELFDLGTEPASFIIYPGGRGYYYDPNIEDTIVAQGVQVDDTALDKIFHDFLREDIRKVIAGFDRKQHRKTNCDTASEKDPRPPIHIFDRRRFHYLRFGYSRQIHIDRVPGRIFAPLRRKSRDELEHYFLDQEQRLPPSEKAIYVAVIFNLNQWSPDNNSDRSWQDQMDSYFTNELCRLNVDGAFMSGVPPFDGLSAYLIRYAISYYDDAPPERSAEYEYIRDFINRHRIHRPPASVQVKMKEAEKLFGSTWRELKHMSRKQLTKVYRRQALKHHPDKGGDPEIFRRLTTYYEALIHRKPTK